MSRLCFAALGLSSLLLLGLPVHVQAKGKAPQTVPKKVESTPAEQALLDMEQAFQKLDTKRLKALLPAVKGHPLAGWGEYWELRARLESASHEEIRQFLNRNAGSYVEDRLRADWLLLLGKVSDWANFDAEFPHYRMRDDREIACLHRLSRFVGSGQKPTEEAVAEVRDNWYRLRQKDDGCLVAIKELHAAKLVSANDIWRKVRLAVEFNRPETARQAMLLVDAKGEAQLKAVFRDPMVFLKSNPNASGEWLTLAISRASRPQTESAAQWLKANSQRLSPSQRNWAWGTLGREAAMDLSDKAVGHFSEVTQASDLTDDMLAWQTRAALRQPGSPLWPMVLSAIEAMSPEAQRDPTWVYWYARTLMALHPKESDPDQAKARSLLQRIAGPDGFYEQLALHALGQQLVIPPRPAAPTTEQMNQVRQNPSLKRALMAIQIGLRGPGVREWNYGTSLVDAQGKSGKLTPELMHAAAYLAFENQVWDRSIFASERSGLMDMELRFPRPFLNDIVERSREIELDPAVVYGLIRQESRFITNARSSVGAAGLMQVMPATARWTAKKLGMQGFQVDQLNRHDVNIAIGTGFLKVLMTHFQEQLPLVAAAYNAGPGRPRKWRQGPVIDAAIWAENIPFNETRDYVKKVVANANVYAGLIHSTPQRVVDRLGTVGPSTTSSEEGSDIP